MTDSIAGLPFWELTFDADGDADPEQRGTLLTEVPALGITDLIFFSHGWNNDHAMARRLYDAFFGVLAEQLSGADAARPVTLGLVGVFWPSQRWSDEPVPDFTAAAAAAAVSAGDGAAAVPAESGDVARPVLDADTLADL